MSIFLNLWFFLLPSYLPDTGGCKVDIGEFATASCLHNKQPCLLLTAHASLVPGFYFVANSIHYAAILKEGKYSFISTYDPKFKTPEGFTAANCLADLHVAHKNMWSEPGWGKFYELPSGWVCAFSFKDDLQDSSKILFFFKKNKLRLTTPAH